MDLFVIYWKIVQLLRHLSCLNYRSGLGGPLSWRVSWSSLQPPGCEATTWEVEGALAEWTGTKFIQFLHLVITFVAFRGSLQMYFSSQYGGYFCTHIEFFLNISLLYLYTHTHIYIGIVYNTVLCQCAMNLFVHVHMSHSCGRYCSMLHCLEAYIKALLT